MTTTPGESVSIPFPAKLYRARFHERPNKFLIRCTLENLRILENIAEAGRNNQIDRLEGQTQKQTQKRIEESIIQEPTHEPAQELFQGENQELIQKSMIEAHLPDPGRLKELLIPGCQVWLRRAAGPKRKTEWSAVLCQVPGGDTLISLDSSLPNRLIAKALQECALPELAGWNLVKPEYVHAGSRWDFLLADKSGRQLFLEVKSVTLVENRVGLFPDAVTARGAKHLRELAQLAHENNTQAALLFVAQREDLDQIRPASAIDPQFANELARAVQAGVKVFGRKCSVSTSGIVLGEPVPVKIVD